MYLYWKQENMFSAYYRAYSLDQIMILIVNHGMFMWVNS